MRNLKVSKKLIISYTIMLILLAASTLYSLANFMNIGKQVKTFYEGPYMAKGAANIIDSNFEAMQKAVFRSLATTDLTIANEAIANARQCSANIQEQLSVVKKHFLGDRQIITRLENQLAKLTPMREHVLELAAEDKSAEAAVYMESNNILVIKEAQKEIKLLTQSVDRKGEELLQSLRSAQARALLVLILLGASSIVVSIIFGMYITRSITRPVAELETAAEKLSNGELDAVITYQSRDELGKLADSMRTTICRLSVMIRDLSEQLTQVAGGNFNIHTSNEDFYVGEFRPLILTLRKMNTDLSSTMRQINQSADQVAYGADQVSGGAQVLSQGTGEQASSVEELAATINEISAQVKRNAERSQQAREMAEKLGAELAESNEQMQEMTRAMDEISRASSQIGMIIKTIEEIAFKTNILALNAAVEAARAGAAGKGFAVVADEVHILAGKSSAASKNTAALIETSLQAVKHGTRLAEDTAASLLTVVEGTKAAVQLFAQIAQVSDEQANSVMLVTQSVDQISGVVQTNSATAEESAAASEELSEQALILKDLVQRFQLKEAEPETGRG